MSTPLTDKTFEGRMRRIQRDVQELSRRQARAKNAALVARLDALEAKTTLPDPLVRFGNENSTITAATAVWQDVPGAAAVTFGTLPEALMVELKYSAIVVTTDTSVYAMIGVLCAGGLALGPEQEQGTLTTRFAYTPFSSVSTNISLRGSKIVTLPAGTPTDLQLRSRRSGTAGVQAVNYSMMQVIPIKWVV